MTHIYTPKHKIKGERRGLSRKTYKKIILCPFIASQQLTLDIAQELENTARPFTAISLFFSSTT